MKIKPDSSGFTNVTKLTDETLGATFEGLSLRTEVMVFYNILYGFITVIDVEERKELLTTSPSDFIYASFFTDLINIKEGSYADKLSKVDDENKITKILDQFVEIFTPMVKGLATSKSTKVEEIKQYLKVQGDNMTEVERIFNFQNTSDIEYLDADDLEEDEDQAYLEQGYVDVTEELNTVIRSVGYFILIGLYDIFYHPEDETYLIHALAEGDTKVTDAGDIIDALILLQLLKGLYKDKLEMQDDKDILAIKIRRRIRELNTEKEQTQ